MRCAGKNPNVRRILQVVCVILLSLSSSVAFSAGLEKLLMPGRVIEGHADIEDDCKACHDADSDQATASLCTSCHEDIGADRQSQSGFHGRFPASQRNECVLCHTDHEGRNTDIVAMNSGLFDHRWTDFALDGAHISVACGDCHDADKRYRVTPLSCVGCHKKDDVHGGGLGQNCNSCHSTSNWQESEFNHDLTDYALTGRHAKVECDDCHRNNNFASTPRRCATCHNIDDVHAGENGDACHDCHSTSSWSGILFDHATTGFPLVDAHAGLQCKDCHKRDDFKDQFANGCAGCHRVEDDHQGRNGEQCDNCHKPTVWSDTEFDHADTAFPLIESHAELICSACHKASTMEEVPATCGECHAVDDSHAEQLGQECETCHQQSSWSESIRFDHDLSAFPLTGLHATVACGACHESNRFHDVENDCASCHRKDDTHKGALGESCGTCHNSNDWAQTVFDHDTHTSFSLDGGHADLNCIDCHRDASSAAADVPSTCGGCHVTDDVHEGQFGAQCDQCHSTTSFKDVESLSGQTP